MRDSGFNEKRYVSWLAFGITTVLLCTGAAKLIQLLKMPTALSVSDAVFFWMPYSAVAWIAAGLEFAVAASRWLKMLSTRTWAGCSLMLSLVFIAYRASLAIEGKGATCKCLGDLKSYFGIEGATYQAVSLLMLCYLLIASIAILYASKDAVE